MDMFANALLAKPWLTLAVGAFMSGVALFYLVMQRTRKHRLREFLEERREASKR